MNVLPRKDFNDVSLVLCGAAGQGVQTIEEILVKSLHEGGYHVFASREYMSRVRGGNNSTEIRVSTEPVNAFVDRIDLLLPFNQGVRQNIRERITESTVILGDKEELGEELSDTEGWFVDVDLLKRGHEVGGKVYSGVVAAGIVASLFGLDRSILYGFFQKRFAGKEEVIEKNRKAVDAGYEIGGNMKNDKSLEIMLEGKRKGEQSVVLNGTDALSLGALAGGCDFVTSYPMSPATGVLTFMAKNSHRFGVAVEQAEDEIAAINLALGASYGGARPMATTSGGGLALMSEGISLGGITELPVVIHVGQRPGPATGMATRTEQADLEFVLHAGHGEFPKAVFAPGSLEEAFYLSQRAFNLAARYQTPVFVLTDQYFLNSYYDIEPFDTEGLTIEKHIVESTEDYQRYVVTEDGISPRSVPGYGKGMVGTDSHEHDADGHVQEDFHLRKRMVEKRLRKMEGLKKETVPPTLLGTEDYDSLVVAWGSTRHIVEEAVKRLGRKGTAVLHFSQVYPLPKETESYLRKAKIVVDVEGNATGQLARLIRTETGFEIPRRILSYTGLQMSVEFVAEELRKLLSQEV
ncbi:MAG: Pyruvate flavodoxin/ferredoxin oxidoreductase domain protein [Synergistales bacterium 54_9]|jgi:2-oxoglutarate ferredoxin oxidoreductase subunit alpha|nr:MAG: Pyruvate flavodoxin/ferredoxin oxidoreductase domain protein [Synergistales bacterium 54_9]